VAKFLNSDKLSPTLTQSIQLGHVG